MACVVLACSCKKDCRNEECLSLEKVHGEVRRIYGWNAPHGVDDLMTMGHCHR